MTTTMSWVDGTRFKTASQRRYVLARMGHDGKVRIVQRSDNLNTLRTSRRGQLGDRVFDTATGTEATR